MIGKCHNLGFTQGSDGLVHATLQDGPGRTIDAAPGKLTHVTRHEGSIAHLQGDSITAARPMSNKLQEGSQPALKGNYYHEEDSNVCHGVSTDNTEGDTMLKVEVLPPKITNTEVDKFSSVPGLMTQSQ